MAAGRGRRCACALVLLLAGISAGCGDEAAERGAARSAEHPQAGGNGILVYAVPSAPVRLDPLFAESAGARTIVAQIYEPLVANLRRPYGQAGRERGLSRSWTVSEDSTVWSFRLRHGVRFQDGSPFNAAAVLANAERWSSEARGRALLPGLIGVDAPRPDLVRFVLARPSPGLPGRLASPQLGIVSPRVLAASAREERLNRAQGAGSGPFALLRRGEAAVRLTRNGEWWGTAEGLGPALDGVQFPIVSDQRQRAGLLRGGQAQAASRLDRAVARRLSRDPLLLAVREADSRWLGMERSVRGLGGRPSSFATVWLTSLGQP